MKSRNSSKRLFQFAAVGLTLLPSVVALAGGCFSTTPQGECVRWDASQPVVWNPEGGALKGDDGGSGGDGGGGCSLNSKNVAINNTQAIQIISDAFQRWMQVPFSNLKIERGPNLADGGDTDLSNFDEFWTGQFKNGTPTQGNPLGCYDNDPGTPCINPIIFDDNGLITQAINGECAQNFVLGFAAILPPTKGDEQNTILDPVLRAAEAVVSGACLEPQVQDPNCKSVCPDGVTIDTLRSTMTHELGHFLGLDHTLVSKDEFLDCTSGDCSNEKLENIPTMIGFYVPNADLTTLTRDDEATFAKLYPADPFADNTCSITGFATLSSGSSGRCLEIIARENDDPRGEAVGTMAGEFAPRFSQGVAGLPGDEGKTPQNCDADAQTCSSFRIEGLKPGTYKININTFATSSGTPFAGWIQEPCDPVRGGGNIRDNLDATNDVNGKKQLGDIECIAGDEVDIGQIWAKSNQD